MRVQSEIENVCGIETQVGVLDAFEAADKKPGDDEQHQRTADLRYNEHASAALTAEGCGGASAFMQKITQVATRGAQGRRDSNNNCGEKRRGKRVGKNAPVELEIQYQREISIQIDGAKAAADEDSEGNTAGAPEQREYKTFSEQLRDKTHSAGAYGSAKGHFARSSGCAREKQVGYVQAGE